MKQLFVYLSFFVLLISTAKAGEIKFVDQFTLKFDESFWRFDTSTKAFKRPVKFLSHKNVADLYGIVETEIYYKIGKQKEMSFEQIASESCQKAKNFHQGSEALVEKKNNYSFCQLTKKSEKGGFKQFLFFVPSQSKKNKYHVHSLTFHLEKDEFEKMNSHFEKLLGGFEA